MKTSVIEVRDMLSVLTVDEVEKRIGEVPGVESATVNYAAGNATVRYDETRLNVADIKVLVHQSGQQSADDGQQDKAEPDAPPATPAPAAPKTAPGAPAAESKSAPAAPAGKGHEGHAAPGATARHVGGLWRTRWAMAARTCRLWCATCATVSGSA